MKISNHLLFLWNICCFRWFPNWVNLFLAASKVDFKGRVHRFLSTVVKWGRRQHRQVLDGKLVHDTHSRWTLSASPTATSRILRAYTTRAHRRFRPVPFTSGQDRPHLFCKTIVLHISRHDRPYLFRHREIDNTQITLNEEAGWVPRSTSNQSSEPCQVAEYP